MSLVFWDISLSVVYTYLIMTQVFWNMLYHSTATMTATQIQVKITVQTKRYLCDAHNENHKTRKIPNWQILKRILHNICSELPKTYPKSQYPKSEFQWVANMIKLFCFSVLGICGGFRGHFRAASLACGGFQASRQIKSCSCQPTPTAHSNAGFLTHWVRPQIEPVSSWMILRFVSVVPWRELLKLFFNHMQNLGLLVGYLLCYPFFWLLFFVFSSSCLQAE